MVKLTEKKGCGVLEKKYRVTADGIMEKLDKRHGITVIVTEEAGSTNDELKRLAADRTQNNILFVARRQTAGKGRMGRSFYSPQDSGVYMSLLVRPELEAEHCTLLTSIAAVAVAQIIEQEMGRSVDIKWVNDIYVDGKKVCGILTESSFSGKRVSHSVVGIGINITQSPNGFPDEIRDIAGALVSEDEQELKNRVIAKTVNRFMDYYKALPEMKFRDEYEKRLLWKGRKINVISADSVYSAEIKGLDEMCHLIVEDDKGTRQVLKSGEITIREA